MYAHVHIHIRACALLNVLLFTIFNKHIMLRRVGWQCLRLSQSSAKPTNNFGPVFARYFAEKYDAAYFDKVGSCLPSFADITEYSAAYFNSW